MIKLTETDHRMLRVHANMMHTGSIALIAHVSWLVIALCFTVTPFLRALVLSLFGVAMLAGMWAMIIPVFYNIDIRKADKLWYRLRQEKKK